MKYTSLCICGDIHGEFPTLIFNLKRLQIENSVIIVAGDCGIGFEKEAHYAQLYNKIKKSLINSNNLLLLMRGNHDDPSYFDGAKIDFERMKCIPDYSVIKFGSSHILCIGGAISVDRSDRKQSMWSDKVKKRTIKPLYWEDEAVKYDEIALSEISLSGTKIETVITHTCPSFCFPHTKQSIECWLMSDDTLSDDIKTEREDMDRIYNKLIADKHPLKSWFYGHFHASNREFINNINFNLLNIMEIKEVTSINEYESLAR